MTTVETTDAAQTDPREALAEQLIAGTTASFEMLSVWLGLRLGLYSALAEAPGTAAEVAQRAGVDARYAREWLEHQAVAGILAVDDPSRGAEQRRYSINEPHREVMLDPTSPFYAAPMTMALASVTSVLNKLVHAYRTGAGVEFADYGEEIRDHIAGMNRPMYEHDLASTWIPAVPGLADRLAADPPARVLDVACGSGWSSVHLAHAYPKVRVEGVDADAGSIDRAQDHAAEAGVTDRVTFRVADAAVPGPDGAYDAAVIFEAVHDVPHPVETLAAIRRQLTEDGVVLVADVRSAEEFAAPGDDLDRMFYGFSLFHCLPAARTRTPSAATGAVMRPDTLRDYARQAGFTDVRVLDIDHDVWRFYLLAG